MSGGARREEAGWRRARRGVLYGRVNRNGGGSFGSVCAAPHFAQLSREMPVYEIIMYE